jgi:hypothetical protein
MWEFFQHDIFDLFVSKATYLTDWEKKSRNKFEKKNPGMKLKKKEDKIKKIWNEDEIKKKKLK